MSIVKFGFGGTSSQEYSKEILGGKGMALWEMSKIGVPVPPGIIIPCSVCVEYMNFPTAQEKMMDHLMPQVMDALGSLKEYVGHIPLVSVRSGARVSMPGMMDTILNVGLSKDTTEYWSNHLDPRTCRDSHRRLMQMYGSVALGVPMEQFEKALSKVRESAGVACDADLSVEHLEQVIYEYEHVLDSHDVVIPSSCEDQLRGSIKAVFDSWNNPRAIEYRKIHGIPDSWGTAVVIQSMVFGNRNDKSATGVVFSQCPSTGDFHMVGEFLVNAQGEDVVAGIRTPEPISKMADWNPEVMTKLAGVISKLESHYRDMQDVEFTVEDGSLYILQTRSGKRTRQAAFQIGMNLYSNGLLSAGELVSRFNNDDIIGLIQPSIDPKFSVAPHMVGIAAGGSVVSGVVVFSAEEAVKCKEPCILIREETDPDDIAGMNAAVGILTATGGLTSHAAVVARGMNKTCVVGATNLHVSGGQATIKGGSNVVGISNKSKVTINGLTGEVWVNVDVPMVGGGLSQAALFAAKHRAETTGIAFRVSPTVDDLSFADAEYSSNGVCIDLALVSGTPEEVSKFFFRVKEVASKFPVTLDFSHVSVLYDKADDVLAAMFGKEYQISPLTITDLSVSLLGEFPPQIAHRVTLVGIPPLKELSQKGFKSVSNVETVADLLNSNGPVVVSDKVVKEVFGGDEALSELKCLLVKEGKSFGGLVGKSLYPYEMFGD